MTLWVVTGRTESGDEFSYVFDFRPTDDEIDATIADDMAAEYTEVGFTNWRMTEQSLILSVSKKALRKLTKLRAKYAATNED